MVSPHHVVKIATALSAVALTASVAAAPAYALQDIAIEDAVAQSGSVTADNGVVMQSDDQSDDQTGDQQSQDSMPDNPNAKLPDNVSDEISDDATVISEDLAATPEGEVKNIETGEIVTDPTLVGTKDQQPDPLAKTNGESFIPVSAEDVKNAVADANVQLSKFESNEYGAHWGTYNNSKAFFRLPEQPVRAASQRRDRRFRMARRHRLGQSESRRRGRRDHPPRLRRRQQCRQESAT